ncbi:hypothetical protein PPYR_14468 [Photinus pyralis]|uniref:BBSome complex member BBS5 PH domain-containing protein n=1 Tax=Photinus pyralis TaxID=7054 RepID=A0A5N4A5G9_PHOPY|nr:Bardet-Biedl syndrome 5 protein homolog [Photinus pyralis]XP_031357791.1 Bardet-Biedl syndrome 5 protein homolog [Photinus pyralis]KAB0792501.1 hypothetical protein PPYR_14460 [Photinus pyralis]KAB0792509.1 hypothetical protein PPYR_14468 [Photinus pyralis]
MGLGWEDKEVHFDLSFSDMRLTIGEKVIDRLDNIEDTKGNGGDRGKLIITNLRILWHSVSNPRINLSIGYNSITTLNTKIVNSKLRGTTQALYLMTVCHGSRYEFIFTNLVPGSMRHFTSVTGVHKAYTTSKAYRELKLRGAVVHNKRLRILPLEQVCNVLHGVWNLSSDQGSLGTFYITNVRLVWFADMNEAFNISLPYLQINSIRIRDSKFGRALVITCNQTSGGYILGFRIDPEDQLNLIFKELSSLFTVYASNPIYGIEYEWSSKEDEKENAILTEDVEEVDDPRNEISNVLITYSANGDTGKDRPIVYSNELGLAIESLKEGYTIQKLWEVVPS